MFVTQTPAPPLTQTSTNRSILLFRKFSLYIWRMTTLPPTLPPAESLSTTYHHWYLLCCEPKCCSSSFTKIMYIFYVYISLSFANIGSFKTYTCRNTLVLWNSWFSAESQNTCLHTLLPRVNCFVVCHCEIVNISHSFLKHVLKDSSNIGKIFIKADVPPIS